MIFDHTKNHLSFAFGLACIVFFLQIFFENVAHDGYPLFILLVVTDFFFEQRIVHFFGLPAAKIMHELSER